MDTASQLAEMTVAVFALIGAWVVAIVTIDEVLPRCSLWWNDVRQGHLHYRIIRRERAIQQEAEGIAERVRRVVELAMQRMTSAAERTQPTLGRFGEDRNEEVE